MRNVRQPLPPYKAPKATHIVAHSSCTPDRPDLQHSFFEFIHSNSPFGRMQTLFWQIEIIPYQHNIMHTYFDLNNQMYSLEIRCNRRERSDKMLMMVFCQPKQTIALSLKLYSIYFYFMTTTSATLPLRCALPFFQRTNAPPPHNITNKFREHIIIMYTCNKQSLYMAHYIASERNAARHMEAPGAVRAGPFWWVRVVVGRANGRSQLTSNAPHTHTHMQCFVERSICV